MDTVALNCLVFEKIAFFCILATDRQTDQQMDSTDALSRSRYRERRLNNGELCIVLYYVIVHEVDMFLFIFHFFADDVETLCRTYSNLAAMFFMKRCYRLSLRCRRAELFHCLSSSSDRRHRLLTAISNLGHALRASGDHSGAILCHRLCAVSAERSADCVAAARELRNVGKNATQRNNIDSQLMRCALSRVRAYIVSIHVCRKLENRLASTKSGRGFESRFPDSKSGCLLDRSQCVVDSILASVISPSAVKIGRRLYEKF